MSWMDFDDIRKVSRGKKSDLFSHKNPNVTWTYEEALLVDTKRAERNHRKAMEAQRKAEELARKKADQKARIEKEKRDKKEAEKQRKKQEREDRRRTRMHRP
jgi:hypothetical protein